MGTLQGFIDDVVTELRTVSGIKYVPGDIPSRLEKWPASPVWAVTGATRIEFEEVVHYTHEVRVGLLGPADDMHKISRVLTGKLEDVIENIYGKYAADGFSDIDAMGDISYTFGPIEWAGSVQFGFLLTIHGVTITNTTS